MKDEILSQKEQESLWIDEEREVKLLERQGKLGKIGLMSNHDILNFLYELSSKSFKYKLELIPAKSDIESLITTVDSKSTENLSKLIQTYQEGISKKLRYSLWIVLHPIDHKTLTNGYEHSPEAQECEILLKSVRGKNYYKVFYSHEDPTKEHTCIFGKKKDNELKSKCNYLGSLLLKYLVIDRLEIFKYY